MQRQKFKRQILSVHSARGVGPKCVYQ